MKVDPRRWQLAGGIWGIVGVAALAVVLALVVMMIPRAEVAARVNGEKILVEDVQQIEEQYRQQGMSISFDQALDQLITQKLLYQEVRNEGYALSTSDAESELEAQLAAMNMTRDDLDMQLQLQGISYEEFLEGFRTGMSIQNYLQAAVEVPEVTEEEIEELYDYYRQMIPEEDLPPLEYVRADLVMELKQQKRLKAESDFIDELRDKADIEYVESSP